MRNYPLRVHPPFVTLAMINERTSPSRLGGHHHRLLSADPDDLLNRHLRLAAVRGPHDDRKAVVFEPVAGMDWLAEVRAAAGHSSVAVTSAYLHIVVDDEAAVGNLFRLA